MLDLPTHRHKRDSGVYPPRLLLTVRALDESQPPTTDLICDLEVRGTVRPCCFRLEMKYSAQGRGILHAEFSNVVSFWMTVSCVHVYRCQTRKEFRGKQCALQRYNGVIICHTHVYVSSRFGHMSESLLILRQTHFAGVIFTCDHGSCYNVAFPGYTARPATKTS